MGHERTQSMPLIGAMIVAACAGHAHGTSIQDLVRLKGHEHNTLVGMGIVVGLDGTGDDSKDSFVAARPYERLLANLGNPIQNLEELADADSYAIVQVTLEVPATGIRSGDRLDVRVSTLFNASSLEGGQLVTSPLRLPVPTHEGRRPMAFASGPIVLQGTNPRTGIVRRGAQMVADIRANPLSRSGTMTFVLKDQYAGYPLANMIAGAINDESVLDGLTDIAKVEDAKNVRIYVPGDRRADPAEFITKLLLIPVDPSLIETQARIVINENEGIIVVTGDVEVGPVIITHRGLTISSVTPELVPTPEDPRIETTRWAELNTTNPSSRASTRVADLLQAFDKLNVSVDDQIAIIYELQRTGKLHAEIVHQ